MKIWDYLIRLSLTSLVTFLILMAGVFALFFWARGH